MKGYNQKTNTIIEIEINDRLVDLHQDFPSKVFVDGELDTDINILENENIIRRTHSLPVIKLDLTNNARYTIIKDLKEKKYITVQITLKDMLNIEDYLMNKQFVEEILADGKSKVDDALMLSEIYEAVEKAIQKLSDVPTDGHLLLEEYKKEEKLELDNYVNKDEYGQSIDVLEKIITDATLQIDQAQTEA